MFINLYATIPTTQVLGPYIRFVVWVQGCPRSCEGCMTPDAQSFKGGTQVDIDNLAKQILAIQGIEGITISGGEPFIQAEQLVVLIEKVREKKDMGLIVYSGYTLQELILIGSKPENKSTQEFLKLIDVLIDGPYMKHLDDGLSLRGSSNQKIHLLTRRYSTDLISQYYEKSERRVEMHLNKNELFLVGIPGAEIMEKWKKRVRKFESRI